MDDGNEAAVPAGRTPGRYIVYGMVAFWVVLFAGSLVLSLRLEPAADRFHNPPPPRATAR